MTLRRLRHGSFVLLALAAAVHAGWWVVPIRDPVADMTPGILDVHVHTAGIGAGGSGACVSPGLRESAESGVYLRAFGASIEEPEREGDRVVLAHLSASVQRSRLAGKAVVLALDGAVDKTGHLDRTRTQVYVPNDFVARETAQYPNLLFGASVNPYRFDALDRLERVSAQGSVLVKWIPAIMRIDPSDHRIVPFYRKLRALGLPLLVHAGRELAFGDAEDAFGDPSRLRLALAQGVTVIAAHFASTGSAPGRLGGGEYFERLLPMFQEFPNLYADVSSLTQINWLGYLARALAYRGASERMIYGSDWALQCFPLVPPGTRFPGSRPGN